MLTNYHFQVNFYNYENPNIKLHMKHFNKYQCYNCTGNHRKDECKLACIYCKKIHDQGKLCYEFGIDRITQLGHRWINYEITESQIKTKINELEKLEKLMTPTEETWYYQQIKELYKL